MRIPHAAVPRLQGAVVISFISVCALLFGYLWVHMGGRLPVVSSDGYQLVFETKDADNLVYDSDVMVAGVPVGKVRKIDEHDGTARVTVQIDDSAAMPLHEGATIHLRSKSLIEETYVEVVDGDGKALPDGTELPRAAAVPSVQLDDVLNSLDAPTRRDLGVALRELSAATDQTGPDIGRTLAGLGKLGRDGYDALDALDAQSTDLQRLVASSTEVMEALDSGQGEIVDLVDQADLLTAATSDERDQVEATMRALPGVLSTARTATDSLTVLSTDLRPITTGLRRSAGPLSTALQQLPATTRDLRGLLPDLDGTLDLAPRTLRRVPAVADSVQEIIPTTRATLADVNPMLAFLEPYGPDLAAFAANWNAMLADSDVNGHYLRILPVMNPGSFKGNPLPLNTGVLDLSNAYPAPGESTHPGPFTGTYPHVERDPE